MIQFKQLRMLVISRKQDMMVGKKDCFFFFNENFVELINSLHYVYL